MIVDFSLNRKPELHRNAAAIGGMRSYLKAAVERALVGSGMTRLALSRQNRRVLILAYHNIVPRSAVGGDRSLHLERAVFSRQLDILARTHAVVPLASALTSALPGPAAAITFDDAYRGAVTAGIEELAERGMPATIFVAPQFVPDGTFWWDSLQNAAGQSLSAEARTNVLTQLQGRTEVARDYALAAGYVESAVDTTHRVASLEELERALRIHPGLTLGSHSWSHPNLAALQGEDLEIELTRPLAWLRSHFDRVIPWIAYPYGMTAPHVGAAARRAGYAGGLRIHGGSFFPRSADPYELPRMNVPAGLSVQGFTLRICGL